MKIAIAQTAFTSGEISPRLWGRADSDIYKTGLKRMVNMIARAHGPAERRGGFEFITDRVAEAGRAFNFQINAALAFIVGIIPGTLEVLQATGLREEDNVVANTSFVLGAADWTSVVASGGTTAFNATLGTATLAVTGAGASEAGIRQQLTVAADSDYFFTVDRPSAALYRAINVRVGTTAGGAEIAEFTDSVRSFKQLVHVPPATTIVHITVRLIGGGLAGGVILNAVGFYKDTGLAITFAVPYTAGELRQLRMEQPPNQRSSYLLHPNHPPKKLALDAGTGAWSLVDVPFVGTPVEWVTSNYPGCLAFHQGRSWWSGVPSNPETVWASKSGAPEDLTTGATDSDGIVFTLSKKGVVRWLMSLRNLLVGTDQGEHILTSEGGVLKPGDIQAEQQSAFGSSPLTPAVAIGNSAAYLTGDRRKLRMTGYRWEEAQWVSVDLTFPSEHITVGLINAIAWAQAPEHFVVMADGPGQMIGCTYEPTLKIVGWHRHQAWMGFYDFCVQIVDGRAVIWCVRRITDPGGGPTRVFFERYDPFTFLDSFKVQVYSAPTSVVTGLGYLEGQTVQIVTDGAVHPDRVVVGGQITLQLSATTVKVGKQFIGSMTLLPWDDKVQGQVTMGMKKRYGKVWARIIESGLPRLDGDLPPDRSPSTPMNTSEPLKTKDVEVVSLGWEQQETLTVEQPLPLPLLVVAVFGELNVGNN